MCTCTVATATITAPKKESEITFYILGRSDNPAFGRIKLWLTALKPSADLENCVDTALYTLNRGLNLAVLHYLSFQC